MSTITLLRSLAVRERCVCVESIPLSRTPRKPPVQLIAIEERNCKKSNGLAGARRPTERLIPLTSPNPHHTLHPSSLILLQASCRGAGRYSCVSPSVRQSHATSRALNYACCRKCRQDTMNNARDQREREILGAFDSVSSSCMSQNGNSASCAERHRPA